MFKKLLLLILFCTQLSFAYIVEQQEIHKHVLTKGILSPEFIKNIYMPVEGGEVIPVASYGTVVQKNDDLFILDNIEQNQQIFTLIHNYQQSELEDSIESAHMFAQHELFEAKAISAKEYKESILAHNKKIAQHLEEKGKLEEALALYQISFDDLEPLLSLSSDDIKDYVFNTMPKTLKAPMDGILIPSKETSKQNHDEALKKGSVVALIANPESFIVNAYVGEKQIRKISPNQSVKVEIPSLNHTTHGRVKQAIPYPDQENGKARYHVIILLDSPNDEAISFTSGMDAIISIDSESSKALVVPIRLVKTIGMKHYVMVKGKKTELREITLGPTSGENIIITSGLSEGDEILDYD